ncbi:hypothetical protein PG997_014195 [Apiospora hydei]|uniref:Uncharacterized protein n=1 Tax=Apiospora hydei TaxID=1337664 RepID=A0ABR1UT37_9PEZI
MTETAPDVYSPWRKEDVPEETSAEFQSLLALASRSSFEPKCYSWKDAPNHGAWCAFGDEGTTALVGAYGDLIQFGTYTGCGQSGMFTADRRASEEPYWVISRTKQLQHWAEGEMPSKRTMASKSTKCHPNLQTDQGGFYPQRASRAAVGELQMAEI